MIVRKDRPLANNQPERLASCKWSSRGTGLLQMIIQRIWPLANDHPTMPMTQLTFPGKFEKLKSWHWGLVTVTVREWPGQYSQFFFNVFIWYTCEGVWSSASSVDRSSSALCLPVWFTRSSPYIYWWCKLRFDILEAYLIFVIFLHGKNFLIIKFSPKNANFSR